MEKMRIISTQMIGSWDCESCGRHVGWTNGIHTPCTLDCHCDRCEEVETPAVEVERRTLERDRRACSCGHRYVDHNALDGLCGDGCDCQAFTWAPSPVTLRSNCSASILRGALSKHNIRGWGGGVHPGPEETSAFEGNDIELAPIRDYLRANGYEAWLN